MKTIILILTILCIAVVHDLRAENTSVENLEEKISSVVKQFFPEKSVERKKEDGAIIISLSTMPFQIHNIDKTGKIAEQSHEEIGPKAEGFLIQLTHQEGPYRGAAEYPQTFTRPYWKTFGTVIPVEANQNHIHISFSYGSLVAKDFITTLTKTFESRN
jgi:hypothetical protein